MTIYTHLQSGKPGASALQLQGTGVTQIICEEGIDWGFVDSQPVIAESMMRDGVSVVGRHVGGRTITIPVMIYDGTAGYTDAQRQNAIIGAWQTMAAYVDDVCRYKGWLRHRPSQASYATQWRVEHARLEGMYWGKTAETAACIRVSLVLTVSAYAYLDDLDIVDEFATNTIGTAGKYNDLGSDWTAVTGALANWTWSAGRLTATTSTTTEHLFTHTGTPHTYDNVFVGLKVTYGAIASYKHGVVLKYIDASNYLEAYLDETGGSYRKRVDVVIAGVRTNIYSATATTPAVGFPQWLLAGIYGNEVYLGLGAVYIHIDTPTSIATLTAAQADVLGIGNAGRVGIVDKPASTATFLQQFRVFGNARAELNGPDVFRVTTVPGDCAAEVDIRMIDDSAGGANVGTEIALGWARRPRVHNFIPNPGFELATSGWSVAAVTGVCAAATSISRITTTPYEGDACGQLVTPGSGANEGTTFRVYRRFRTGVTYNVEAYVKSATSTANMNILAGVNGDVSGTIPSQALSTTWTKLSTSWRPTADRNSADVCIRTNGTSALTMQIDRVMIYEDRNEDATTDSRDSEPPTSIGGHPPFGIIEGEAYDQNSTYTTATVSVGNTSTYRGGFAAETTANYTSKAIQWHILPWTMDPDPGTTDTYTFTVVGGWYVAGTTVTGVSWIGSVKSENAGATFATYSLEYGNTAHSLTLPTNNGRIVTSLGTYSVRCGAELADAVTKFELNLTTTGTGVVGLDWLAFLPVRAMAGTQWGTANYDGGTLSWPLNLTQANLIVRSDLSGQVELVDSDQKRGLTAGGGLLGTPISMRPGVNELVVVPTNYAVDFTTAGTISCSLTSYGMALNAIVHPRVFQAVDN